MRVSAPRIGSVAVISLLGLALAGCMQAPDPFEAINGDWQQIAAPEATAGRIGYRLEDSTLNADADGWSFAAPMDGSETEVAGRPGTTVSVQPIPVVAFRQVFKSDGQPVRIVTVAVVNRNTLVTVDERGGQPPTVMLSARR